jgi:hypothetical protein
LGIAYTAVDITTHVRLLQDKLWYMSQAVKNQNLRQHIAFHNSVDNDEEDNKNALIKS